MQGTVLSTIHTLASSLTHGEGVVSHLIREGQAEITQLVLGTATSQTHVRLAPHPTEGQFRQCSEEHFGEKASQQGQMSQSGQREWSVEGSVRGKKGSSGLCLSPSNGNSGAVIRQATDGCHLTAFFLRKIK